MEDRILVPELSTFGKLIGAYIDRESIFFFFFFFFRSGKALKAGFLGRPLLGFCRCASELSIGWKYQAKLKKGKFDRLFVCWIVSFFD